MKGEEICSDEELLRFRWFERIFPPNPCEIKINIKSFYSENIQLSAYSESPIFEVTGERYYMGDSFLLIKLHANVTPPEKEAFEEYLKREKIDFPYRELRSQYKKTRF